MSLRANIMIEAIIICHAGEGDSVVMSLRGRVATEAISYLIDIIEIATFTVVNSQ